MFNTNNNEFSDSYFEIMATEADLIDEGESWDLFITLLFGA